MSLWRHDSQPDPRVGVFQAEEMVEREPWNPDGEDGYEEASRCIAFQRLRSERQALALGQERLREERADLDRERWSFYLVAGMWTAILLLGSLLAAWTQGGAW
jgi:hypothetical protein